VSSPDSVAARAWREADDPTGIGIGIGYWYRYDPIILGIG